LIVSLGLHVFAAHCPENTWRISNVVYYETIKRKQNRRLIYECRWDERLKAKAEGSTRLAYTGLRGGLEHLKIETRFFLVDRVLVKALGSHGGVGWELRRL
jgi:hypothetical protein